MARFAGKLICKHLGLLYSAQVNIKRTNRESEQQFPSFPSNSLPITTAVSHTRTVFGYADAKALNFQLARLKHDEERFQIFIAERAKLVSETTEVASISIFLRTL